jgi:dihydroorotate dehydrogenase electron transfer subunit
MNVENARVLSQTEYSRGYNVLVLKAPVISASIKPGQFVYLLIPRLANLLLRRPFSVLKAKGDTISILYKCVGRGTHALKSVSVGEEINLLGPLGNGYPMPGKKVLPVLVAGGYGAAPLCFLAQRIRVKGIVFMGGADKKDILCKKEFKKYGWKVHVATENGSRGRKGLVTDILDSWLDQRNNACDASSVKEKLEIFACGPDGMLKAVGKRAAKYGFKAWLSLEKHMGCGVGACLACVQKIRQNDGTETWKRVCKDGPVFEAGEIVWG